MVMTGLKDTSTPDYIHARVTATGVAFIASGSAKGFEMDFIAGGKP
ncbi:MAG: hypothetical protein JW709_06345 [Sedimentisphaerales bacterium]|nr:hypothetical protein [Sedimentisphaerales bacterium]